MTFLSVENLCVSYQTKTGALTAVDDISFHLEEGRSLGFVGESGCGKTTIGMALMGLLPENGSVTQGRILYKGQDLVQLSDEAMRAVRWKAISMIFQAAMNALNPVHRVNAQIREAIVTHHPRTSKEDLDRWVESLFDLVGLPKDRMLDFPHQFSGGMKQRAIIAMALGCMGGERTVREMGEQCRRDEVACGPQGPDPQRLKQRFPGPEGGGPAHT